MLQGVRFKQRILLIIKILEDLPQKRKYLTLPLLLMGSSTLISLAIPILAMQMLGYLKNMNGFRWENFVITGIFWLCTLIIVSFLEFYQKLLLRKYAGYVLINLNNKLLDIQYSNFLKKWFALNSKELSDEVNRDLDELYPFISGSIFDLFRNYAVVIIACIILITLNVKLTLALSALLPIYLIIHFLWYSKLKKAYIDCRKASRTYLGYLVEFFQTFLILNIYNSKDYEKIRVSQNYDVLLKKRLFYFTEANKKIIFTKTLSSIAPIYLLFCVFIFINFGWTTITEIVGFWGVFSVLLSAVNSAAGQSLGVINSAEVYKKILYQEKYVRETSLATSKKLNVINEIEIKNINLLLNSGSKVLKFPDFKISRGEWLELRGKSGVGKTSLIRCILGQIDPSSGCVNINSINLNNVNLKSYLNLVGFVEQNGYIYSRSIKENIVLNRPYDSFLYNKVVKTARLNSLHHAETCKSEKNIGENGIQLSGGERQRIIIARALYHSPQWLIFDEPFAGLDKQNIKEMINIIGSLRKDYTAIIVSHRELEMIKFDRVIDLDRFN